MRFQKFAATLCVATLLLTLLLAGCSEAATPADGTTTAASTTTATTTTSTTATTTAAPTTTVMTTPSTTATMPSGGALPDWQTPTTTTVVTSTQLPSTDPVSELVGYKENADGTLTDKSSGIVFIDDDMSAAAGEGAKAQTAVGITAADGVCAMTDGAAEAYLIYYLKGGIADVAVTTRVPEGTGIGTEFALYTSTDGKKWQEAPLLACSSVQTANGISTRTGYFYFNETNITYIKVQLAKDKGCQLDRVRVGNVQSMHTPFERVENREAATFYVDAKNGSDENDGLTEKTAFKTLAKAASRFFGPGDKLLLKRGGTYEGGVTLQGLGLAQRRITVGAYGKGADPVITGGGNTALALKMDYVTVENLEITNPDGISAMSINPNHTGAVKGIIVQNCYIHDVNTDVKLLTYSSGGINFDLNEKAAPTWFDGLVIRNNTFKNLARTAVYGKTIWAGREGTVGGGWGGGATNFYQDDDNGWFPARNVVIALNTMDRTYGDSVVIIGAQHLRISHNVVFNAFCVTSEDLARILSTQGTNKAAVALWSLNCNDVYIEHNEVGYTNLPGEGRDGEAFDIDALHKRIFIQYNYAHHNEGGFLLICGVDATNGISCDYVVRYNLSVDDACQGAQGVFMATNTTAKLDVYNNTIIQRSGTGFGLSIFGDVQNYYFRNNIFSGVRSALVYIGHGCKTENMLFDNNIYTDGAYLPTRVFYGAQYLEAEERGFTVTETNRLVENPFANPDYVPAKDNTSTRDAAIEAYTPIKNIGGAYKTPVTTDINGDKITDPFYGCIIPKG